MNITDPQPAAPAPKLRWCQFSLRTLLVVSAVVAVILGSGFYAQHLRSDTALTNSLGGEESRQIIRSPEAIDVYLLRFSSKEHQVHEPAEHVIVKGPVRLPPGTTDRVAQMLNDPQSYYQGPDGRGLLKRPAMIRMRFIRQSSDVWIDFRWNSDVLQVHRDGQVIGGQLFDPIASELFTIVANVFPEERASLQRDCEP